MVASSDDVLWFNIQGQQDIDCDDMYDIGDIREVMVFGGKFYVLANKFKSKVQTLLLEFDVNLMVSSKKPRFLCRWNSSLTIGDAGIHMLG